MQKIFGSYKPLVHKKHKMDGPGRKKKHYPPSLQNVNFEKKSQKNEIFQSLVLLFLCHEYSSFNLFQPFKTV